MLTDKEKEIALECAKKMLGFQPAHDTLLVDMMGDFLSRIREEQEADAYLCGGAAFHAKYDSSAIGALKSTDMPIKPLFTTPPAAPFCPRQFADGGRSSTAVLCGDLSSAEVLIERIQNEACEELVAAFQRIKTYDTRDGIDAALMRNVASEALANHAKRMKGGE